MPTTPSAPVPKSLAQPKPAFVLVHGAWLGGWCWRDVARSLREAGHAVHTPTMTGVGERRRLLDGRITLDTWVDDVCATIEAEELRDVTLVGHSLGGRIAIGVTDRMSDRVRQLVLLDAAIPLPGLSILDQLPEDVRQERLGASGENGIALPVPEATAMGITDPAQQAWYLRQAAPQPLGVYSSVSTYTQPIGQGRPVTFIAFTEPAFPLSARAMAFAHAQSGWRVQTMPTGHCAMLSAAPELATMLLDLA